MPKSAAVIKRRASVLVPKPKGVRKPAPFAGFSKKEVQKRSKKSDATEKGADGEAAPTICSFFKRGKCRNGDTCKFLHPAVEEPSKEVQKLTSGITAVDTVLGKGDAVTKGRMVTLKYLGRIAGQKGAKPFDGTVQGEDPLGFVVGDKTRASSVVVRGIDIGVLGMKAGGKRTLFVPACMAYGEHGSNFNASVPRTKKKVPPATDVEFELVMISVGAAPNSQPEKEDKGAVDATQDDDVDGIDAPVGGDKFVLNPHKTQHKKKLNKAAIKAAYREHGFAILENSR